MAKYITEDIYVPAIKENCISYTSTEDATNTQKNAQALAEEPQNLLMIQAKKSQNKLM